MENIKHFIPRNLSEALEILSNHKCYILCGGTDLMVMKHRRSGLVPNFDTDVIYISNLQELNYIKEDSDGAIHIGATTKYVDIVTHPNVPKLLKNIISEIASPNIRNMASLAGNVANASPAGDSLVGLYLLDAKIVLRSIRGERILPIEEFVLGVRKINRLDDELITEIIIPSYKGITYWKKVGSRAAESISKISFAGAYQIKDGKVNDLRLAYGSVSITTVRRKEIEQKYIGLTLEELKNKIPEIMADYSNFVKPITDQRSTKEYRFKVAMNITKKFLEDIQ